MIKIDEKILEEARLYADRQDVPLKDFIEEAIELAMIPERPLPKAPEKVVIQKVYVDKPGKDLNKSRKVQKTKKKRGSYTSRSCIGPNSNFDAFLLLLVHNIELALIDAAAVADEDYTHLDLFKLAEPYMLHELSRREDSGETCYFNLPLNI